MAEPTGRFRSKSGRVYGGESAPRRDALGFMHHDTERSDGDHGRSNRIYGQNVKRKLPRPPKGRLASNRVR